MFDNVPPSERLTTNQVIEQLQEIVQQYPEFGDSELEVNDEFGELFYVVATDIANGPWIIIKEAIDKTPHTE